MDDGVLSNCRAMGENSIATADTGGRIETFKEVCFSVDEYRIIRRINDNNNIPIISQRMQSDTPSARLDIVWKLDECSIKCPKESMRDNEIGSKRARVYWDEYGLTELSPESSKFAQKK